MEFLSALQNIYWTTGYKYRLEKNFWIQTEIHFSNNLISNNGLIELRSDGRLLIKKSYSWDGASGLTFDTKSSFRGALTHDAFYELMRDNVLPIEFRKACDRELWRICILDGMWKYRANIWYKFVRVGGLNAATKKRKIYIAP